MDFCLTEEFGVRLLNGVRIGPQGNRNRVFEMEIGVVGDFHLGPAFEFEGSAELALYPCRGAGDERSVMSPL